MLEKRLRVRHRAPRHIDEDRAVAHPRKEGVVGQAACRVRKGNGEDHDVGRRQQLRELGGGADRPARVGSSAAPDAAHVDLERCEPVGYGVCDPSGPDDENRRIGQPAGVLALPQAAALIADRVGELAQHGDDRADGELRRRRLVDARRVGDQEPFGNCLFDAVVPN